MKDISFRDQRTVTDEDFLKHVRLPGALGKRLRSAAAAGDLAEATRLVARHFRTRSRPRWAYYMHGGPWLEIAGRGSVMDNARMMLKHRFRNAWSPEEVEDFDGAGVVDWKRALAVFGGYIARNAFVPELTTAFALTGDAVFLKKVLEFIRTYVDAAPFVLEDGFFEDHDRYFGGDANCTLDVCYRCLRWLDLMHSGALQIPGVFSDADVFWFVKQLWFYAMQFARFCGDEMRRDNHHLCDHGHAPFVLGTMFPEFSASKPLIAQGLATIMHHFKHNIFADGGNAEHCMQYQYHIAFHYFHALALARANGMRLFADAQVERLRKWVELNIHACKPDEALPEFGDGHGVTLEHFFDRLAPPVMTPRLEAMARAAGYEPGHVSGTSPAEITRSLSRWKPGTPVLAGISTHYTARRAAAKPRKTALPVASAQFPNGGYTFFRSAWTPDADYLAVSHYTDSMPHGHAHWDMMSFVLHTGGQTLIGDPASRLYGSSRTHRGPRAQEIRGYSYNPASHNCLVMDDDTLKPLLACGHECFWGGYPPKHGLGLFEAGGPIEVAEMWHDAYTPTRHRRFVVQVKGAGFAFVDMLSRPGLDLRPHQYSQLYHFEKEARIEPEAPGSGESLVVTRGDGCCLIVPGGDAETSWKTWRDAYLAGVRGADVENGQGPLVAELTRRIEGPCVFTTFFVTGTARAAGRARYLGANPARTKFQQHDGLSANALDLGRGETLMIAACPYRKPLESLQLCTDAELAVVHTGRGGVRAWALVRGTRLRVNGADICRGTRREWRAGA